MTKKLTLRADDRGIVAIIVTVLLMLILSLIVLAVSQNATREQRQTLDRQLSDQAFYNAESGINDAAYYIYTHRTDPTLPNKKDNCNPLPSPANNVLDQSGTNKYTCVLYDRVPPSIQFDSLSESIPKTFRVKPVDASGNPVTLANLVIRWNDPANPTGSNITGTCNFSNGAPELPASCGYGGVRVEMIRPLNTRDQIRNFTSIFFVLPSTTVGNSAATLTGITYPDNQGIITGGDCSGAGTYRCSKTISGIAGTDFFVSIRALYQPVNVSIEGSTSAPAPVFFKDAQVVIDATGKSADVLRRVKVRLPANSQFSVPGAALQTKDSICKVITVTKNEDGTGEAGTDDPVNCPII